MNSRRVNSYGSVSGWLVVLLLSVVSLAITVFNLTSAIGLSHLSGTDRSDVEAAVLAYSTLPRIAAAIVAGGGLGVSGMVFQDVLRNPIAEPATLGVSAGAYLAVTLATVFFPNIPRATMLPVAIVGAGVAISAVLAFAWSQRLTATAVALAGMTVNLVFGSLATLVATFHRDGTVSMMFWASGSLYQNGWMSTLVMIGGVVPAAAIIFLVARAVAMFTLQDDAMRSLGINVPLLRLVCLGLATFISADIVAGVGMIGFVGLASAWMVRLLGMRSVQQRLAASIIIGAFLLLLTDQLLVMFGPSGRPVTVGTVSALVGAPLLLVALTKEKRGEHGSIVNRLSASQRTGSSLAWILLPFLGSLLLGTLLSRSGQTWFVPDCAAFAEIFPWRWPRVLAATASGGMLALAGGILQRLTGNDMASPEALGISSGAILGGIIGTLLASGGIWTTLGGAAVGAAIVTVLVIFVSRKKPGSGSFLIMTGVALSTVLTAVAGVLSLYPDPRLQILQIWIVGSAANVTPLIAWLGLFAVLVGGAVCLLFSRWLDIVFLGEAAAVGLGLDLPLVQTILLGLVAMLSALATLMVGPLTFAGLLAPHIARRMYGGRAAIQLMASSLVGATIMVLADAIGRLIAFPYEIPAGIIASIGGGLYLLTRISRP